MSHFLTKFAGDQVAWDVEFVDEIPFGSSLVSGTASAIDWATQADATSTILDSPDIVVDGTVGRMRLKGGDYGALYIISMHMVLDTSGQVPDTLDQDVVLRIRW